MKFEFCWRLIFEILIIHKPSPGSCEVSQQKLGRIGSAVFDVYWIQTDKQSIYIEAFKYFWTLKIINYNSNLCLCSSFKFDKSRNQKRVKFLKIIFQMS